MPSLALVFGACGGKSDAPPLATDRGDGSQTTDVASGGTYVSGTHSPGCPESQPSLGSPCSVDDASCEYGDDFNPACNTQLHCGGGKWNGALLRGDTDRTCPSGGPPKDPPPPANGKECPASKPSGACTGNVTCRYGDALEDECACGPICRLYPVQYCEDAGADWRCAPAPKNTTICPVPRPRIGDPCSEDGRSCRVGPAHEESCEESSISCRSGRWALDTFGCPTSSSRYKEDIRYVDEATRRGLAEDLLAVRLAKYKYRPGVQDHQAHLGFIIEDQPEGSPAVLAGRDRVDLYGYVSMAVATIQVQQKQIDTLEREVASLKAERAKRRVNE